MKQISVIGAGLMGHGIAQVFALAGHIVRVYDSEYKALASLRERIEKNLRDLNQNVNSVSRVFPVEDLGECVSSN